MTRRMTRAEEWELAQQGIGPMDPQYDDPPEPDDQWLLLQWFTEETPLDDLA